MYEYNFEGILNNSTILNFTEGGKKYETHKYDMKCKEFIVINRNDEPIYYILHDESYKFMIYNVL